MMYTDKRPLQTYLPFHYHRIPASIRFGVQKLMARKYKDLPFDWFIENGEQKPLDNIKKPYWPDNKQFAVVLTHDIDTEKGIEHIEDILDIERKLGLKSCVYVPAVLHKKHDIYFNNLRRERFEIGIHGYNHDNKLAYRYLEIPSYISMMTEGFSRPRGFRSPSFLTSFDLMKAIEQSDYIDYDSSIPDIRLFPYENGCNTIYPFEMFYGWKLIELPVTMPTDATLLALDTKQYKKHEFEIEKIWAKKHDFIAINNGMCLLCTHAESHLGGSKKMLLAYELFLERSLGWNKVTNNSTWFALPHEVATWWRSKINESNG